MPNFDRTGPAGQGPMTGRGLGFRDRPPTKPLPKSKGALAKALMKKSRGLNDQSIFPKPISRPKTVRIPKVSLGK